jgi:ATP-dependent RNA helicase
VRAYGLEKPSPVQQRGIVPIIQGRDMILQSQSGTGKTCVFALGAISRVDVKEKAPQVLILSPTRELAQQSQQVLLALGEAAGVPWPPEGGYTLPVIGE